MPSIGKRQLDLKSHRLRVNRVKSNPPDSPILLRTQAVEYNQYKEQVRLEDSTFPADMKIFFGPSIRFIPKEMSTTP